MKEATLGPAMGALLPRQRSFVDHLFIGPQGPGRYSRAYRQAGYASGNAEAVAASASRLMADPGIQAAISEVARKTAVGMAPEALDILKQIMRDPQNKDQFKAAKMFQEAAAPPESTQKIEVTHRTVSNAEQDLIDYRAMRALGVAREKLIEMFGDALPRLERVEGNVVDAEFVEVEPADPDRGW